MSSTDVRQPASAPAAGSLHVGPFFLILALSAAIAAFLLLRGQPLAALIAIAVILVGAGLTAAATYRTVAPLSHDLPDETTVTAAARAELERDKALTLRAIKELEFDHAMGKVSDADFAEMRDRLRARAVRLMADLEGGLVDGSVYRTQIERDLAGVTGPRASQPRDHSCAACGTVNDADARFCKQCGKGLS